MRLGFSGAPEIAASAEHVWQRLMDHEFVASCAPGVETVETLDDSHFRVTSGLGVGSISVRFDLDVAIIDLNPPTSAKMAIQGKAPGSAVHVESAVTLEELTPDRTLLNWNAAAQIHGKIASVGARAMKGTVRKITENFWREFASRAAYK